MELMGFVVRNEVFVPGDVVVWLLSAGYCLVVVCMLAAASSQEEASTTQQ